MIRRLTIGYRYWHMQRHHFGWRQVGGEMLCVMDDRNARQASAFRPGKESAKPVRASLGANDQSAAVVREHQPCELFPIARA